MFEYIDGLTLAKCVENGPLSISEACAAIRDAALGLVHAHAAGLVHRDIKPGNLIRDVDGIVKVLDFGLVVEPSDDSSITGENIVMGTPDYISPEQANDPRLADARSDIYSLGLHTLPPAEWASAFQRFVTTQKARRAAFCRCRPLPDIPKDLQAIVAKMMAKRPEDRYQTAAQVVSVISPYCSPQIAEDSSAETSSNQPLKTISKDDQHFMRWSRRAALLAGCGTLGSLLLFTRTSCRKSGSSDEPSGQPVVRSSSTRVLFTDPSDFADGGEKDIEVVDNRLILNAISRDQVWLNFRQIVSSSLEIYARFCFVETRDPEPIVKFIFQAPGTDFHEYHAQFWMGDQGVFLAHATPEREKVLDRAKLNLKPSEFNEIRFRIDEAGLTLNINGKPVLHSACQRTSYHACVSALYCKAEISDGWVEKLG